MGEILVAYDGSETAKKAVDHALNLMKPEDKLVVITVVPSATIKEFADIEPEVSLFRARESLNELLSELERKGIVAEGVLREGDIADEILKMGFERDCDLMVVGHKGISKIGRFQLGSVADKVARYANRPVLIVR
ncbi:MAG: universal stress protein [Thermoplasmata archaeon]|nr:MAG: universal stress protein [Thermoplasmata archaeon]